MSKDIRADLSLFRDGFRLSVNLSIPARGITGVFGPSGAGKTTLLRCIAGLEPETEGTLRINDTVWQDGETRLPAYRRAIGFVFQDSRLFEHLDVRRNLEYGLSRTPEDGRRIGFDEVVALLDISPLLDRPATALSGGEAKRVAIGRALLRSPALLLLDEPLAGLDAGRKAEIMPYLDRLHRRLDIPILYVSHDMAEICRLADCIIVLENGEARDIGPTPDVLARLDPGHHAMVLSVTIDAADAERYLGLETAGAEEPVRIAARDVSLADTVIEHPAALSTVDGVIRDIGPKAASGLRTVSVEVGPLTLLSLVNEAAAATLALAPGDPVLATIWHARAE